MAAYLQAAQQEQQLRGASVGADGDPHRYVASLPPLAAVVDACFPSPARGGSGAPGPPASSVASAGAVTVAAGLVKHRVATFETLGAGGGRDAAGAAAPKSRRGCAGVHRASMCKLSDLCCGLCTAVVKPWSFVGGFVWWWWRGVLGQQLHGTEPPPIMCAVLP